MLQRANDLQSALHPCSMSHLYHEDLIVLFPKRTTNTDIQLFREGLSEKKVHATIPKGNLGYDQYTVSDTVAVEPTFTASL